MSETVPANTGSVSYPADEENQIMFVTPPMEEDVVIGGYVSAKLFLSSSSNGMAALTYLSVLDEDNEMVPATAKIRKGWKLCFTLMAKNSMGELIDLHDDYSAGATNTVYSGKEYPSYVQIPVIG